MEKMGGNNKAYWRATLKLLIVMLSIWALTALGVSVIFADFFNKFSIGGYPLGFWFAQQGSIYIFIILIFTYTAIMKRIDKKYDVHEDHENQEQKEN
jgi:putative solute:sodium symporter small subunit